MDTTGAYRDTRLRIATLLRELGDDAGAAPVPACPAWTVQQLTSHVVGVSADILAGRLEGVGSDPWTDAQVEARLGRSLTELVDEWDDAGPRVEAARPDGQLPAQAVFDLVTHEHDLRGAVGRPGGREHPAVGIGLTFVQQAWPFVAGSTDVPPLRVVITDTELVGDLVVGERPDVTLHLTAFEALRAFTGRRSLAQLRAYDWGVDASPWLPAFTWGPFTPTLEDLDG